tara:strand:+ start:407 stop:853 length:447 start_codon:yes stop_codon:yes gene_type:complete
MKNLFLTFILALGTVVTTNAQNSQGDWYLGTGDISGTSWTELALTPSVGYAFSDNIMAGLSLNQGTTAADDSTGITVADDINIDIHVRYFFTNFYGYAGTQNLTTDFGLNVGVGKLFTTERNLYLDPRVVFNTINKTTNLSIGFGLKF